MKDKIIALIKTNEETNIDLAIQLSKSVNLFEYFFGIYSTLLENNISAENIFEFHEQEHLNLSNKLLKKQELFIALTSDYNLHTLLLGNNNITDISLLNTESSYITYLNLRNNLLDTIPNNIKEFNHLSCLNLSNNQLKEIPFQIQSLTKLIIGNNNFCDFPKIAYSPNLKKIHIPNCSIYIIPLEICYSYSLRELNLHGNQLLSIPKEIGYLKKIKRLILTNKKRNSSIL